MDQHFDSRCISLVTEELTLDLYAPDAVDLRNWVLYLHQRTQKDGPA